VSWFQLLSPIVFSLAVQWARRSQARALRSGRGLSPEEMRIARRMGVRETQKIRIVETDRIPLPNAGFLGFAARWAGFHGSEPWGLSLGYGIFIRNGWTGSRKELMAHEFVHTAQFERMGGMRPYLVQYLHECLTVGYNSSPMEQEAVRLSSSV